MKKFLLLVIAIVLLSGYSFADMGIPQVPETQGIVTSTTVDAVGNLASMSEIQWRITTVADGLPSVPPLEGDGSGSGIYESVYTEDTLNHGIGLILYDKELDVETSNQISGQWNIEATKELAFVGVDGARVVSSDVIFVDGARDCILNEGEELICPFASAVDGPIPTYCNRAEAGSTVDMTVANIRTTSTDRFIMGSGDHPVELNHDLVVTELIDDLPSMGTASAYMEVLIQEGGGERGEGRILKERIEFSEETTVTGDITSFEKLMHYESGMVR
ncbi:MAG: hypothetical protein MUE45_05460 [Methanoregulaceae archaeon]|nr:hypothetical protein [Methanoregulaceae archaeon]MCU0628918.1 hypothetical protein [Methanoregulaceae archaeon]